ncbi:MAG: peptidase T [Lachnospiraceae bacterium]|nr:peptidase T [Lachnospiraceae bacterium]
MKPEERLLKYVQFDTTSDPSSTTCPSTPNQLKLAEFLKDEMISIGLSEVRVDENGYVYGVLDANVCTDLPKIGLIAHMDTSDSVPGGGIKPKIVRYEGGEIPIGNGLSLNVHNTPNLARYRGHDLIVTDGSTLLGSDDKTGISEILTAMEYLVAHPEIRHGRIAVAFTPDEEIGRGADRFDVEGFGCDFAYTVDGGTIGGVEYENFNAASADIEVKGYNVHPGSAKGRMKNAALMLAELIGMMPEAETPSHTEGYEGFFHLIEMKGDESSASAHYIIRDHDRAKFEARKQFMSNAVDYLNSVYGEGTFKLALTDSYYNMREKIEPCMFVVDRAMEAYRSLGIEPKSVPIRGGTDGARLSFMGLPCPNLSTGGENFHGVLEFVSIQDMRKMTEVLIKLVTAE